MESAAWHRSEPQPSRTIKAGMLALTLLISAWSLPSSPLVETASAVAAGPGQLGTAAPHGSSQATGTATIMISTMLTTTAGQPAAGSLAGYSFALTGQNGLPSQTLVTNQLGQVAVSGLSPGVYTLSETLLAGSSFASMTINGVAAQQQQPFQLQAGGNYSIEVTNVASGSANITIQVQLVDENGQAVTGANLSSFSFTLTSQSSAAPAPTTVSSSSSGQASTSLTAGPYTISESAAPGASLVNYTINGVPTQTGQFTVGLGQSITIVATNRAPSPNLNGGLRSITLSAGCNNVASTYPDGTTGQTLASGISPSTGVAAVWRFDNTSQTYKSVYFPALGAGGPPPVDVSALSRFDAIWICVTAPATLSEPNP